MRKKDKKIFKLPRKFTKKQCTQKKIRGFTMRSSCAPYKSCRRYKRTSKRFRKNKRTRKGGNNTSDANAVQMASDKVKNIDLFISDVIAHVKADREAKEWLSPNQDDGLLEAFYLNARPLPATFNELKTKRETLAERAKREGWINNDEKEIILEHKTWIPIMSRLNWKKAELEKALEKANIELENAQKKQDEEKKRAEAAAVAAKKAGAATTIAAKYRMRHTIKKLKQRRKAEIERRMFIKLFANEFYENKLNNATYDFVKDTELSYKVRTGRDIFNPNAVLVHFSDNKSLLLFKEHIVHMISIIEKYVGCKREFRAKRRTYWFRNRLVNWMKNSLNSGEFTNTLSMPVCEDDKDPIFICKKDSRTGDVTYIKTDNPCEFAKKREEELKYLKELEDRFHFAINLTEPTKKIEKTLMGNISNYLNTINPSVVFDDDDDCKTLFDERFAVRPNSSASAASAAHATKKN